MLNNELLKICLAALNEADCRKVIKELLSLKTVSRQTKVRFAFYCAKQALPNCPKGARPKEERCLALVERWLANPRTVSEEELREAADAAYAAYAAYSAAYAAYAAYPAAYAAYAADAAVAAYSAYYAARSFPNEQREAKLKEFKAVCVKLVLIEAGLFNETVGLLYF